MPSGSNIRWRETDLKSLSNAVRTFNAKRTKLIKQVPELQEILPQKASVKELKSSISTRADFNRVINRLDRFKKKDATKIVVTKEGVRTTKYQVREIQIQKSQINRKRAELRKKANVSTEKGTMGAIHKMNLQPKKSDYNKIPKANWNDFVKLMEKQSMDSYYTDKEKIYKENYLKAIANVYGKNNSLYKFVKNIPPDILVSAYYDDPILQIEYVYPTGEDLDSQRENVLEHWKQFY